MVQQAYTTDGINPQVPFPISSTRDPTSSDIVSPSGTPYGVGQQWINTSATKFWVYGGSGVWILNDTGTGGPITQITGDSGGAEVPLAGNFNIKGTANQVLVAGTANTETISLIGPYTPATYTAHGVLVGEGTSSIVALTVGTNGQVLTGNTGADPAFAALGTNSGLTAHGVLLGEGNSAIAATAVGTNGQVFLGSTGADPAFGTLTTSTGIGFTAGAASLALNITGGGFNVNAAATGTTLVAQNSYNVVQAGLATFALPATASVGSMYLITSAQSNAAGWTITQAAGQEIWSNTSHTTNGATGTLSGARSTSVLLMCTVANLEFIVLGNTAGLTFA